MTKQLTPVNIGTGIHDLSYYSTEVMFKDCFLQADPIWHQKHSGHWPGTQEFKLTLQNLPTYNPTEGWWRTHMRKNLGVYEAGKYFLITDGEGEFIFDGDSKSVLYKQGVFYVIPSMEGFSLIMKNLTKFPTYLHIVHEGYFPNFIAEPFHPLFLSGIRNYKTLRFMDACGAFSNINDWGIRTKKNQPQNTAGNAPFVKANETSWPRHWATNFGMAYEYMYELCNLNDSDLYVCIPPLAPPNYVFEMVRLLRSGLRYDLKIYLEYSNEMWNIVFPQAAYGAEQANTFHNPCRIDYSKYWFTPNSPNAADNSLLALFWQAYKMSEFVPMLKNAGFSAENNVFYVFAMQTANSWNAEEVLKHLDNYKHFDYLTCNGYFGHNENLPSDDSSDPIWERYLMWKIGEPSDFILKSPQFGSQLTPQLRGVKALADKYNLKVILYEAGQHIIRNTQKWRDIQNSQIIYNAYTFLFRKCIEVFGPDVPIIHYYNTGRWGPYGSWGAQETLLDFTSPKLRAIQDAIDKGV